MLAAPLSWQDLFVDRPLDLARLDSEWDLAKAGQARIVALVAEQGFGKTRLAQRFFHRLSTRDDAAGSEGWWPDQLEGEHATEEVTPVLKQSTPASGMPFLWWGFKLRDPGSSPVRFSTELTAARATLRSYLRQHLDAQLAKVRRDRMIAATRKLALDLVVDQADALTFGLVGTAKTIAEGSRDIFEAYQAPLGVEQDHVEAILADLRSVCVAPPEGIEPVPICLLIDDYQWLSADLEACRLLDRLCEVARQENWPLLIVVTSWERGWLSEANQARLVGWNLPVTRLDVGPVELGDLVRQALPGLTNPQVSLLLDRAEGNPRSLKYLLANLLEDRRQCFADRDPAKALTTDGEDYVRHQTHDSVVAERFMKSPQQVKILLAAASLQGIGFAPALATRTCKILSINVDEGHLDAAERPYAFIYRRALTAAEFRQNNVWRAAADWLPNLADPEQARQAFSRAMEQAASEAESATNRDAEDELLARERQDDEDVWKRNEGRMALLRLYERASQRREFAVAANVAERWFDSFASRGFDDFRYAFDMQMYRLVNICDFLLQGPRRHDVARVLRRMRIDLASAYRAIEGPKFSVRVSLGEPDAFRTTLALRNISAVFALANGEGVPLGARPFMARSALEITQAGIDAGVLNWRGMDDLLSENAHTRSFSRRKLAEYHDLLIAVYRLTSDPKEREETSRKLDELADSMRLVTQDSRMPDLPDLQIHYRELASLVAAGDRKDALAAFEKTAAMLATQALHEPTFARHVLVGDWHEQGLRAIYGMRHRFGFPRKLALRGLEAACRALRLQPWDRQVAGMLVYLAHTAKRTSRKSLVVRETAELLRAKIRSFDERLIAETGSATPAYVPRLLVKTHGQLCIASARLQHHLGNTRAAIEDAELGVTLAAQHLDPMRYLADTQMMWGYRSILAQIYLRTWHLARVRRSLQTSNALIKRAEQICQQHDYPFDPFAFMRGEAPDLEAQDLGQMAGDNGLPTIH